MIRTPAVICQPCFNLVIKRLLISGSPIRDGGMSHAKVSISLSSGFSFQVLFITALTRLIYSEFQSRYQAASHFRSTKAKSPSRTGSFLFQSRYRAASHFRTRSVETLQRLCFTVSISLSSGFSFQENTVRTAFSTRVKFQSRYRAASHFRSALLMNGNSSRSLMFQSRYRAASHFR